MKKLYLLALTFCAAFSIDPQEAGDALIPSEAARQMAHRVVGIVTSTALPPRSKPEQAKAIDALMRVVEVPETSIRSDRLYDGIDALLATIDADGHSFLVRPASRGTAPSASAAVANGASAMAAGTSVRIAESAHGKVLHWTPPAVQETGGEAIASYVRKMRDDILREPAWKTACALVIDLSRQTGGNSNPPLQAMDALFSPANQSYLVDNKGTRIPLFNVFARVSSGDAAHDPLTRFSGLPLAVVVGEQTSSAGEMLLVALLGETARVRTFGWKSGGQTTVNMSYPMQDGSTLVVSEHRYAVADDAPFKGGIVPVDGAGQGDGLEDVVQKAAAWSARQSRLCQSNGSDSGRKTAQKLGK